MTEKEQELIFNITEYFLEHLRDGARIATLRFDELWEVISSEERALAQMICNIDPDQYGYGGDAHPSYPIPEEKDLHFILDQQHSVNGEKNIIPPRPVPKSIFEPLSNLMNAMEEDTGKRVLVQSGYRSPAYQLFVFLFNLPEFDWSIKETMRRVALPGYSEHSYPPRQAIDFTIPQIKDKKTYGFEHTEQFSWLSENAGNFGFELSYPEGNGAGRIFEPWHWRYIGK